MFILRNTYINVYSFNQTVILYVQICLDLAYASL